MPQKNNLKKKYDLVYKTRTTPFFPIVLLGKEYSARYKALAGVDAAVKDPVVVVVEGEITWWFFPSSLKRIGKEVVERIVAPRSYQRRIIEQERRISLELRRLVRKSPDGWFSRNILTEEGEQFLRRIFGLVSRYAYFVDVPGFFIQLYWTDELKRRVYAALRHLPSGERDSIFTLLLSSPYWTNYERFVRVLHDSFLKKGGRKSAAKDIARRFFWLVHDYLGDIIDETYVLRQVEEMRREGADVVQEQLREIRRRIYLIKKHTQELPLPVRRQVQIVQQLLRLYNDRKKEVINPVNIYLRQMVEKRMGNISFRSLHRLYQLSPEEIISVLRGEHVENREKRWREWVYLISQEEIAHGDNTFLELVKGKEEQEDVKGMTAYPGKVRGRVRVILNISQMYRFRRGEILVTPFTNVNYLPVMRRARAIVTEVGGLTSHAAVVSRELKIPCVVGASGVLSFLNDGDLVEVDAERGIVRRLKKEKR